MTVDNPHPPKECKQRAAKPAAKRTRRKSATKKSEPAIPVFPHTSASSFSSQPPAPISAPVTTTPLPEPAAVTAAVSVPNPPPPSSTTVPSAAPPYPLDYGRSSLIQTQQEYGREEQQPSRVPAWMIVAGLLVVCAAVYGAVRLLPCMTTAGPKSWHVWSRVAPNLICSLDLHATGQGADKLLSLSDSVAAFKNLRSLDVSGNELTLLPDVITTLSRLTVIKADHNALVTIPADIGSLTGLTELDVRSNRIAELPISIVSLTHLERLILAENRLSSLPEGIEKLTSLRILDLEKNHIIAPPAALMNLSAIEQLKMAGNTPVSSAVAVPGEKKPMTTASSPLDTVCDRNFTINGYTFCLPDTWIATVDASLQKAAIHDVNKAAIATVTCPISDASYDQWHLKRVSRTYEKNKLTYGADLWTGTRTIDGKEEEPMMILFIHRNSFSSWFGKNYQDVGASCQFESKRPSSDQDIFHSLFLSAY